MLEIFVEAIALPRQGAFCDFGIFLHFLILLNRIAIYGSILLGQEWQYDWYAILHLRYLFGKSPNRRGSPLRKVVEFRPELLSRPGWWPERCLTFVNKLDMSGLGLLFLFFTFPIYIITLSISPLPLPLVPSPFRPPPPPRLCFCCTQTANMYKHYCLCIGTTVLTRTCCWKEHMLQ